MSRPIFRLSLSVFALLVLLVFIPGISFAAIYESSVWSFPAFWITSSGGAYGTLVILILTCVFYTRFIPGHRNKLLTFTLTLVKLVLVIGLFAFLNEYLIKLALKRPRPCHSFIVERSQGQLTLSRLYAMENSGRHDALKLVIEQNTGSFDGINPQILNHWTEETGYSFPSGHSFNGFLLAYVLAFSLYNSRSKTGRKLYFLPLVWAALVAISRVALGAHTAWDVSFGALTGITMASLLMYFNLLRDNLLHRRYRSARD